MCMENARKHLATLAGWNPRSTVERSIGETDPPIVPGAGTIHEQGVCSLHGQRPDRLQNVRDGRRPRARVAVIIGNVREQAGDASTVLFLDKDIAVITIQAYS